MGVYTGTLPAFTVLEVLTSTDMTSIMAAIGALNSPRSTYTPTWRATTTPPVLNNGVLVGRYTQVGKFVVFEAQLTIGSTSTVGAGAYSLDIPVPAASFARQPVAASILDVSAGGSGHFSCTGVIGPSGTAVGIDNVASQVSAVFPMVPAVGDVYAVSGIYEAA